MGLSIIVSGAIVMIALISVLFAMPNVIDTFVSVSDTSSQATGLDTEIIQTDPDLDSLFVVTGLSTVNFTLVNTESEKLWNFDDFDVFVTYDGVSGDSKTEVLSYEGDCPTIYAHPTVGFWCFKAITGVQDPGIINSGESGLIVTKVSENLANTQVVVSLNTDNGVIATLVPNPVSSFDINFVPPVVCVIGSYGITFLDTDTGIAYVCDPTRDKWLSLETMTLIGEEDDDCNPGNDVGNDNDCHVDFGSHVGGAGSNPDLGIYLPHDITITAYSFSSEFDECDTGSMDAEIWGSNSAATDEPMVFLAEIATGFNDDEDSDNALSVDVNGNQYVIWGIDNNCGGSSTNLDDFNVVIYFKWHHADP